MDHQLKHPMRRIAGILFTVFLLALAPAAWAQSVVGPLQAQNLLSEIAAQGSTAEGTARTNLGLGAISTLAIPSAGIIASTGTALQPITIGSGCTFTSNTLSCSGSGGTGTVNSGTSGQLTGYTSTGTAVSGLTDLTFSGGALTHGVAGSVVGSDIYANATSGSITIAPPTGALGAVTLTLPDASGVVVCNSCTQTLTGKSIAASEINSEQVAVAQGGTGLATTTANYAFLGPNGSGGAPSFRAIVNADLPSPITFSTAATVSAAGTTQGTATVLSSQDNAITTCAAGAGVQVASTTLGAWVAVLNQSANNCLIYPPSGAAWNSLSTNAPATLVPDGVARFKLFTSTQGYTS